MADHKSQLSRALGSALTIDVDELTPLPGSKNGKEKVWVFQYSASNASRNIELIARDKVFFSQVCFLSILTRLICAVPIYH